MLEEQSTPSKPRKTRWPDHFSGTTTVFLNHQSCFSVHSDLGALSLQYGSSMTPASSRPDRTEPGTDTSCHCQPFISGSARGWPTPMRLVVPASRPDICHLLASSIPPVSEARAWSRSSLAPY